MTDIVNSKNDTSMVSQANSRAALKTLHELKNKCTFVVVYIHWGRELLPIATPTMRKLANDYIDAGADVIIGTHPHVFGPVEIIKDKPVFFSIGNFLFDQKYKETKTGAVVSCNIDSKSRLAFSLTWYRTEPNSYLPRFVNAEEVLPKTILPSNLSFDVERTWTGLFAKGKSEQKIILKRQRGDSLWSIKLYDLSTNMQADQSPPMPIKKLQPIDINNDGILELVLIQEIYSSFDKEQAKRVFVYSFNNKFHALWRGTALSRPLIDAVYIIGKDRKRFLLALHSGDSYLKRDKKCSQRILMAYKWNGFGFSGIKEWPCPENCTSISKTTKGVNLIRNDEIVGILNDF